MPLTYHFRPFPKPGEPHLELRSHPASSASSPTSCPCRQEIARCKNCRHQAREERSTSGRFSHNMMASIKEEMDPLQRSLTPKAIRDQRRASSRTYSPRAAFEEAVSSQDYFSFYHSTAFARSPLARSESSNRERSRRRPRNASDPQSRESSAEQAILPATPDQEPVDSREGVVDGEQDLSRRDS